LEVDSSAVVGLGIKVSGGTRPRLSSGRSPFVFVEAGFRDVTYLLDRVEHVSIDHLVAIRLVEGLDERVLIRFARLDEPQLDVTLLTPLGESD
jgi:hypothetical protein